MTRPRTPREHDAGTAGGRGRSHDRGVSEVLSFILAFSIITMMVGILYVGGSVSLAKLETGNQIRNAEGVFLAVDDSMGELQEGQAPKRAGSIDLDVGASMGVRNDSTATVEVNGPGFSRTLPTRALEYTLEDRAIAYETGAVFRTNDGQTAMVGSTPEFICSPESNGSVISIVTLVSSDGSIASGTATVTGIQRSTKLLYPTDRNPGTAIDNVTVNVSSPREEAWNRYLTEAKGWTDDDDDGTFACESADTVFVRQTVVEIRLEG